VKRRETLGKGIKKIDQPRTGDGIVEDLAECFRDRTISAHHTAG